MNIVHNCQKLCTLSEIVKNGKNGHNCQNLLKIVNGPVGIESGANIIKTDARTSEAVALASKQVLVASEPLQEKQDEEATSAR